MRDSNTRRQNRLAQRTCPDPSNSQFWLTEVEPNFDSLASRSIVQEPPEVNTAWSVFPRWARRWIDLRICRKAPERAKPDHLAVATEIQFYERYGWLAAHRQGKVVLHA